MNCLIRRIDERSLFVSSLIYILICKNYAVDVYTTLWYLKKDEQLYIK